MSAHTPGPWRTGVTLATAQTVRWSAEEIAANDAREKCRVYANFSTRDEGRGRKLVAVCQNKEDAQLVEAAPDLLKELKSMVEIAEMTIGWFPAPAGADGPLIQARAAIAKAENPQPRAE